MSASKPSVLSLATSASALSFDLNDPTWTNHDPAGAAGLVVDAGVFAGAEDEDDAGAGAGVFGADVEDFGSAGLLAAGAEAAGALNVEAGVCAAGGGVMGGGVLSSGFGSGAFDAAPLVADASRC